MKYFKLVIFVFVLSISYKAKAFKDVNPTSIKAPVDLSIASGYKTSFTYWIKNTGDETILVTDTIYVQFGEKDGSNITMQPMRYVFKPSGLAVGDSFTCTLNYTITWTNPGTMNCVFKAGIHKQNLNMMIVGFNVNVGVKEREISISKVWFSNSSINYQLIPVSNSIANLNISNINGQIVKSKTIYLVKDNLINGTVSMGILPKGIYILNVQTQNSIETKKFTVN